MFLKYQEKKRQPLRQKIGPDKNEGIGKYSLISKVDIDISLNIYLIAC
jgi:hypothetical protein